MTVYLVGAGPGDPELITVRGARLLQRADAVVYDRLTAAALLDQAPPGAELVSVGKDPAGHSVPQERINEILIELGRRCDVVVRLKGGDPFVFARGGEEVDALDAAGIPVDVVPGITSALAVPAAAGIAVTRRFDSTSVTVVTGHEAPGGPTDRASVDWDAVAKVGGTIVVLMGVARIAEISAALIAGGRDASTPAAAVRWGTTSRQSEIVTTLGGLPSARLASPSVIVIGDVVGHRHDWHLAVRPLRGVRVGVTRPEGQTDELVAGLRDLGADVVTVPGLRIVGPEDGGASLRDALSSMGVGDWLVVTSPNGARVVASYLHDARSLAGVSVAAIGPSTASALADWGVVADLVAPSAVAESLVDAFPSPSRPGARAVLARAARARDVLPLGLQAKGWDVIDAPAYRSRPAEFNDAEIDLLRSCDVVTVTSSSIARRVIEAVGVGPAFVTIGPITSATVRELGASVAAEADPHTTEGLVAAIVDGWCRR